MNKIQRTHILGNVDSLTEFTLNARRLFVYLDAFNLLSLAERQVLLSFPDDKSRLREMYTVLSQKDSGNYYDVIKSLKLTNNKNAANILEEICPSTTVNGKDSSLQFFIGTDFQVTRKHVAVIVEILEVSGISQAEWEQVTIDLIEKNYFDMINLVTPSLALKMMKTLDAWTEKSEDSSATFSKLLYTISQTNRSAAELLLANKDEIVEVE